MFNSIDFEENLKFKCKVLNSCSNSIADKILSKFIFTLFQRYRYKCIKLHCSSFALLIDYLTVIVCLTFIVFINQIKGIQSLLYLTNINYYGNLHHPKRCKASANVCRIIPN